MLVSQSRVLFFRACVLMAASLLTVSVGSCTVLNQSSPHPTVQALGAHSDTSLLPAPPAPPKPSLVLSPVTVVSQESIKDIQQHDSGLMAAAHAFGRVDLWDTRTKTLLWTAAISDPNALFFSADAKTLVIRASVHDQAKSRAVFCDIATGHCQAIPAPPFSYAVLHGDHLLMRATCQGINQYIYSGNDWQLWSVSGRALLLQGVGSASLSPDGQHLVAQRDGGLHLHHTATPEASRPLSCPVEVARMDRIDFSPDSALIIASEKYDMGESQDRLRVCIWSTNSDLQPLTASIPPLPVEPHVFSYSKLSEFYWRVNGLDLSSDGKFLRVHSFLYGDYDAYDETRFEYEVQPVIVSTRTAEAASALPDTTWAATIRGDHIESIDIDALMQPLSDLSGAPPAHAERPENLLVSANGQWLLTYGDGFARWRLPARVDSAKPTPIHTKIPNPRPDAPNGGALLSPDGSTLYFSTFALVPNEMGGRVLESVYTYYEDGVLSAIDLKGEERRVVVAEDLRLQLLSLTPDGGYAIACQTQTSDVATWDLVLTGDILATFERVNLSSGERQTLPARFTACPPSSAVSASAMRAVAFGPPADATVVDGFFRSAGVVQAFEAYESSGEEIYPGDLSAGDLLSFQSNPLRVVDLNTGDALLTLPPDLRVRDVALSANGELLAVLEDDQEHVALWSVSQKRIIARMTSPQNRGRRITLQFSAEDRVLLLTSEGQIWAIDVAHFDQAPVYLLGMDAVSTVVRAPDKRLFAIDHNGLVLQWDLTELTRYFDARSPAPNTKSE